MDDDEELFGDEADVSDAHDAPAPFVKPKLVFCPEWLVMSMFAFSRLANAPFSSTHKIMTMYSFNLLYPKYDMRYDAETMTPLKELVMHCKFCDHEEAAENKCVYVNQVIAGKR